MNGLLQYSGTMRIRESSDVVKTEVKIVNWDKGSKTFEIELTVVSCVDLTDKPSMMPSQVPSIIPSKELSFSPSQKASELPSNVPSKLLSPSPSQAPSTLVCPVQDVLGAIYTFELNGICCRVEIFETGEMQFDIFAKTCSNEVFNPTTEVIAVFDSIDQKTNTAVFVNTQKNTRWIIHFKKSLTAIETRAEVLQWNDTTGEYELELSVLSCTQTTNTPSVLPSYIPSDLPSKELSTYPSQIPSTLPSNEPSTLPSNAFSMLPSQVPSMLPSGVPSFARFCTIEEVFGPVYHFIFDSMCWRVEMFENGKIEIDIFNPTCSNEVFNPTAELGVFEFVDDNNNMAVFLNMQRGYRLTVRFKELLSIVNVEGEMKRNIISSNYDIQLKLNSCTSMVEMMPSQRPSAVPTMLPSAIPSLSPSHVPTIFYKDCPIKQVLGAAYRFRLNSICWRVEMFENGKIQLDIFDSKCSKDIFTSMAEVGVFDSVNVDNNVALFVNEYDGYHLRVGFKESSIVINAEGIMTGDDIQVKLNSCAEMVEMLPSQNPSIIPSLAPTAPIICPIDQVVGVTYTFSFKKACWKLELFEKGVLKVDFTDPTCSKTDSTSYITTSLFSSIDEDLNVVKFTATDSQQYSGSIQFRESIHATKTEIKVLSWDDSANKFEVEVAIVSCTAPSNIPSI